jgi:hypothetical protein
MSTKVEYYSNATEILPGLWLGDIKASLDTTFLRDKQIQCIINCTDRHPFAEDSIIKVKHRLSIKDNLDINGMAKLYQSLDHLCDQIKTNIISHNILIHCYPGKQRSTTIIIAYLMKYGHMDLQSAMIAIKSKNPDIFELPFNFEPVLQLYWEKLHPSNT